MKHAFEASMDARDSRIGDGDKREVDRRKHRSSKSRKHSNADETEEHDGGRRKSSGDKNDGRKRPSSSSRAGSGDEDDYNVKRESSFKAPRKNPEERGEKRSSEGFQDREAEASCKSRDEESDRNSSRKANTIPSGHESFHSKNRSNMETPHENVLEKVQDKDSRYPERKDSNVEKGQKHRDADTDGKTQTGGYTDKTDSRSVKPSDHNKHGPSGDRTMEPRYESGEVNVRAVRSSSDKDVRSTSMEERRIDGCRSKNRSRLDAQDEDNRPITADANKDDKQRKIQERTTGLVEAVEPNARRYTTKLHEEKGEKGEGHRQQLDFVSGSRDEIKNRKRSVNLDEDEHSRMSDRSGKEVGHKERPQTPERIGRHHRDLDDRDRRVSESDNERRLGLKGKEPEEGYRVDKPSKGKDNNEIGKCRDFEDSKDQWKRSQTRQDSKEGDTEYDHVKEKDSLRREQERVDSEKFHWPGYRGGTRIRPEDGKELSIFGSENKNTNTIEIIPNGSRDFGRLESFPTISRRRAEVGSQDSQLDFVSGMNDEEWGHPPKEKEKMPYSGHGDDLHERYNDGCSPSDQNPRRNSLDIQRVGEHKGTMNTNNSGFGGSTSSGSFNRVLQQGPKAARPARGGRGRLTGREAQRVGVPPPMMDPPFGHLGLLPGPMQTIAPNMPHSPGPPIGPGVLTSPFPGPLVWPAALGVDMNMLATPAGTRFALNMGTGSVHGMYFNQAGLGRGALPNMSAPGFNSTGINSYGTQHDKVPTGWGPLKSSGPSGRAPSRGEQNDYSQNFVDTGMRPQNFIRELELTNVVEDYPKLRDLIQKKDEIVAKSASPPMYYKCDLHEHVLSPEFFGTKFDVILVDPPWEEYVHRAPGITDHMEHWSLEEIQNLKIEAISDTPSFIFLWVGDGAGLEQGRLCLKKWGFRRCEDICWVKTNKTKASPGLRHDSRTLFQHSKEHCLMGIKGTVRRSIDGHVIHANIDTDVIIADEPALGSTKKPEDMYRIIEHFSLGRRRLELFGEDHNIRSGWLTIGKGLSSSNFNFEAYIRNFADKDGKVWQGIGGRNPPPEAPHLVVTTPEIENLRPRSPPSKNPQQQPILLQPTGSSNNRRPAGSSLQYPMAAPLPGLNHDASGSDPPTPLPWAASPRPEGGHGGADNKFIGGYGFDV